MPVYNAEAGLEKAISSTLQALPADSELAIWEDGSNDTTPYLLEKLAADQRVQIYSSGNNVGVANGLNELLRRTDSEFVARMDADDKTLPWRFRTGLEILQKHAIDVLFTTIVHANSSLGLIRPAAPMRITSRVFAHTLLFRNPVAHGTMIGRRQAVQDVGGYRSVASEDYDMWMRMVLGELRLYRAGIPSLVYRHHSGQVTADADWQARAHGDSATSEVHAELTERLLGERHEVFAELRRSDGEEKVAFEFLRAVKINMSSLKLGASEKLLLLNELRILHKKIERSF